ncbi:MAG: choice-of-anchor L domain-containing protein [Deltaproteobacteria bacterium]|nr:choice-of-anchor L domain-containing protein [Deltaproteobacteria bacterium]
MRHFFRFGFLMFLATALFALPACTDDSQDDAEDAIEDALGLEVEFNSDDLGVSTPDGWNFLFAVKLEGDDVNLVVDDFKIDLTLLDEIDGIDLSEIDHMIAMARVDGLSGFGKRLRYANKMIIKDNILRLDNKAISLLGDSIGPSGEGWYAIYYADVQNGYIRGTVECNGDPIEGAPAVVTAGGFFTYSASDGAWALPTLAGLPGVVTVSSDECVCASAVPVTDTNKNPNPKSDDPDDTPKCETFPDDTPTIDAEICVCCPPLPADDDTADDDTADDDTADDDTADDDTADDDTTDDDTADDDTADDDTADDDTSDDDDSGGIDFENGSLDGWQVTSDCAIYGISGDAHGAPFPGGSEANYLYASSGGNMVPSCTMTLTTVVPDGMSELEISYDFISQEYEEWVGSVYNDIFTVIVQGSPEYLVNRTVNNVALVNDWSEIAADSAAATIAQIASSVDAQYNPSGSSPHSNGPYQFDGHLVWGGSGDTTPRGLPENDNLGRTATVALPTDMSTITIIVTISDVGDKIYDSVGAIDYLMFK